MNKYQKQTSAIACLLQLCCSGLPKELVIMEFLRAVRELIPSDSNAFKDTEKEFTPNNLIFEYGKNSDYYLSQTILDYWTSEKIERFAFWFISHPVLTSHCVFDDNFYPSDFFNTVTYRLQQHQPMIASVMYLGRPIGMVSLFRPKNKNAFDINEQAVLVKLMPYIAHAMKAPQNQDIQYSENGETGMMVMRTEGEILFHSQAAQKLLDLASHPIITVEAPMQKVVLL